VTREGLLSNECICKWVVGETAGVIKDNGFLEPLFDGLLFVQW